jgi:PTS system ascorbate-specific IIA component
MTAILVVAHAPLASSLAGVAAHVYPDCNTQLKSLDVDPQAPAELVLQQVREAIASFGDAEVLVMTDVFGATPCNAARQAADGLRVRVVAGVSVPMLWRTLCYGEKPLADLVERALEGGAKGVMNVPPELTRQNQSSSLALHDQDPHHHQQ